MKTGPAAERAANRRLRWQQNLDEEDRMRRGGEWVHIHRTEGATPVQIADWEAACRSVGTLVEMLRTVREGK